MRTVAISTICKDFLLSNYGSFFQHYALRQMLRNWGFCPFRVRRDDDFEPWLMRFIEGLKNVIRPYYWILRQLPERDKYVLRLRHRNRLTKKFLKDYSRLIAPLNEPMMYGEDTIGIKGGDQVLYSDDDEIWLCRVRSNNLKICYAASCDWYALERHEVLQNDLRRRLADFSAIGVREFRGVEIISRIIGRGDVVVRVADPVLLLSIEEFRRIESKSVVFSKPTLLCYLVNVRNESDFAYNRLLRLAEKLYCELRIIGIQGTEDFIPEDIMVRPSPSEFLRAIDDAEYLITNSFHGLLFGLIYQKRFLFVPQRNLIGADQNERQTELLYRYGLECRIVDMSLPDEDIMQSMKADVDWAIVREKNARDREYSINWLKKSLGLQ